jgi:hypothetical protein
MHTAATTTAVFVSADEADSNETHRSVTPKSSTKPKSVVFTQVLVDTFEMFPDTSKVPGDDELYAVGFSPKPFKNEVFSVEQRDRIQRMHGNVVHCIPQTKRKQIWETSIKNYVLAQNNEKNHLNNNNNNDNNSGGGFMSNSSKNKSASDAISSWSPHSSNSPSNVNASPHANQVAMQLTNPAEENKYFSSFNFQNSAPVTLPFSHDADDASSFVSNKNPNSSLLQSSYLSGSSNNISHHQQLQRHHNHQFHSTSAGTRGYGSATGGGSGSGSSGSSPQHAKMYSIEASDVPVLLCADKSELQGE